MSPPRYTFFSSSSNFPSLSLVLKYCIQIVKNIRCCIKVAEDFVSPENLAYCITLTDKFRKLPPGHKFKVDRLGVYILSLPCPLPLPSPLPSPLALLFSYLLTLIFLSGEGNSVPCNGEGCEYAGRVKLFSLFLLAIFCINMYYSMYTIPVYPSTTTWGSSIIFIYKKSRP